MNNDDINEYVPSLLNPRTVKKLNGNVTLTQNSVVSRGSLSLKKRNGLSQVMRNLPKNFASGKENSQTAINLPYSSNKEVTKNKILEEKNFDLSACEELNPVFSIPKENHPKHIKNDTNSCNLRPTRAHPSQKTIEEISIGFSAIEDLNTIGKNIDTSPFSFGNLELPQNCKHEECSDETLTVVSSATDLVEPIVGENNDSTLIYDITEQPLISVSFGFTNCETVDISTGESNIKKIVVTHIDNTTNIDCDMIEDTVISLDSDTDDDMKEKVPLTPPKKSNVSVNLEIKKKKLSAKVSAENSKVLILNTNAIERLSHVIVQPPNYKLVKRQILDKSKFKNSGKRRKVSGAINGKACDNLKQTRIDSFLNKTPIKESDKTFVSSDKNEDVVCADDEVMSRNLSASEAGRCDRVGRASVKSSRRENEVSPKSIRLVQRKVESPRCQQIKLTSSEAQRVPAKGRNDSASSHSPRKNVDSLQFNIPTKSRSHRNSLSPRQIPHYKIVAGTHFAVDAFSYGDIANVKHYFLTHFHSDHYSGLKKGFNKFLFCSQITADLCVSRLGVNPKCIHVINVDATITVDGIEVTAVDANHCPGALMLVFTLPNGKTLLHTGDFRASPLMESFPIFWNKDIHTIYLDTTYCNPRYDFPTQDQSLEMALYLLRQKKLALEKAGKKFSSVLIVCGTYTIGKEKFFLGMARRVGCSVWACPEKDRVLQAVEGRSFGRAPPHACQLHVVPMRDLTHEKLRIYLNTLQGAFSEVVAFKPSGWENGKNSSSERDMVTIHGIPYSEHSSFSEMIRFVKFLKPKQVVPTVDISGGIKSVQKYFPCPMVCKDDSTQNKLTDYFSIQLQNQQPSTAVT